MRIEVGKVYRHRNNPEVGYAKVLELIPAKSPKNPSTRKVARVEWSQDKRFEFGLIKHFAVSELVTIGWSKPCVN